MRRIACGRGRARELPAPCGGQPMCTRSRVGASVLAAWVAVTGAPSTAVRSSAMVMASSPLDLETGAGHAGSRGDVGSRVIQPAAEVSGWVRSPSGYCCVATQVAVRLLCAPAPLGPHRVQR